MAIKQGASNWLVPAGGNTSMWPERINLSPTPYSIDFTEQEIDGVAFRPYGVWIDNSKATGETVIVIQSISFAIRCPAGAFMATPFPAPLNLQVDIVGDGECTVVFVDSPVMPIIPSGGGVGPSGGLTDTQLRASPLEVTGPLTDTQLRTTPVEVTGALTNAQLRASPVEVTQGIAPASCVAMLYSVSDAGQITGAFSISVKNSGNADGTIAGGTLRPGESVTFESYIAAPIVGVNYDATGTQFDFALMK